LANFLAKASASWAEAWWAAQKARAAIAQVEIVRFFMVEVICIFGRFQFLVFVSVGEVEFTALEW
jgi:hypothetical protein